MKNKKEKLTKMISIGINRATTPQTGWAIFQKIHRKISISGNEVCIRMNSMCNEGLIKRVGFDDDSDSLYVKVE